MVSSAVVCALALMLTTSPPALAFNPAPTDDATDGDGDDGDDGSGSGSDGSDGSDGSGDSDDSGEGFDFPAIPSAATATAAPPPPPPRAWALTLLLRSDEALWTERLRRGALAKARQSVDVAFSQRWQRLRVLASVHGEWDGAYQFNRADYDAATVDAYASLLLLRETYAALSLGPVELTVGRQIVVFGEGDAISPLDLANPRDMREPGLADLVDMRVPVLATRVGYFQGVHRFEALWIHEAAFGFRTPPMGPFSPLPAVFDDAAARFGVDARDLLQDRVLRYAHLGGGFGADQQQLLLRWVRRGEGVDVGLVAGSVLDQQGVVAGLDLGALIGGTDPDVTVPLQHLRYQIIGTTGAWVRGGFLVKWELAYARGRPIGISDLDAVPPTFGYVRRDAVDAMIGVTYRGFRSTTVALELGKTSLRQPADAALFPVDAALTVARIQRSFLRERLDLLGVFMAFGARAQYGWLARAEATALVSEGVHVGAGYVTYHPGEAFGPFAGLDRHDRLMLRLRWERSL